MMCSAGQQRDGAHIGRRGLMRGGITMAVAALLNRDSGPVQAAGTSVIVIGAGLAGLAAARDLRANGFSVVILEGRERTGGRIRTDRSLGPAIDLGASWIHGVSKNPISQLANDFGVATARADYENAERVLADGGRFHQLHRGDAG